MNVDSNSSVSNDSTTLQKLGFDNQKDTQRTLASVLNRMRNSSSPLSIIMEIISYLQILAIAFNVNASGILDSNSYTSFIGTFFNGISNFATWFPNRDTGYITFLIIFACLLICWVIFYLMFSAKYKSTKTFYTFVVNTLYYLGFHVFKIVSVPIASLSGYYFQLIFNVSLDISSIWTFVSIALLLCYMAISSFMLRIVQSSPEVDIKNKFCFWPQNFVPPMYRLFIGYIIPFLLIILHSHGDIAIIISNIIILLSGIGGIITIWYSENNVFPSGKIILSIEYVILIATPILSIIYRYAKGNSLFYILAFLVIVISMGFILNYINVKFNKKKIDLLYSKFENLTSHIKTTDECITLMKIGIVFNATCITNHTLLNWAISRWPHEQKILLIVSYILYVMKMPYHEILDLVSVAVDIEPFTTYDGLLFYQIFNRLPTHEHQVARRLESIRKLYDIPKGSLQIFWEAVLSHQWDEVATRCKKFSKEIDRIDQVFQNLIFENPSSDEVIQEYIKFAMDIQGNFLAANAAQKELNSRKEITNSQDPEEQEGSIAMSKLSSVKSSIFMSDISESVQGIDKVQNGIQAAVTARPIYWPTRFLTLCIVIAITSLVLVVVSYVLSYLFSNRLDKQVDLDHMIHDMVLSLTKILYVSLEFTTHNLPASQTIDGSEFKYAETRSKLNTLSNEFDSLLANSFAMHNQMPSSFLKLWITEKFDTIVLSPVNETEYSLSLMTIIRIYQMRSRTLAFSPKDYIGTLDNPSAEILMITYLFDAVSEVTELLMNEISKVADEESKSRKVYILLPLIIGLSLSFVMLLVFCIIILIGIRKEFDFLISLYSSIPSKVLYKMLNKEELENDDQQNEGLKQTSLQKKSLPSRIYHFGPIIVIFLLVFILTPLPVILNVISFFSHTKNSLFVLNGLYLSSQCITSFGKIGLHSFRILTSFPTSLTDDEELRSFTDAAEMLLEKYNELFFGGTEFFPDGMASRLSNDEGDESDTCNSLIGHGKVNHECSELHDDLYYIYGLAMRLNNIDNPSGMGGVSSEWWRLFYPAISDQINTGIDGFTKLFGSISDEQRSSNYLKDILGLVIGIIFFIVILAICILYVNLGLYPSIKSLLHPLVVINSEFVLEAPFIMRFLQGDFDNPSRQTGRESRKKSSSENSAPLIDFILEGVLVMTADGTIIASNKKYHKMMANTAEEVLGLNVSNVLPSTCQPLFDLMTKIKEGGTIQQNLVLDTTLFTEDDKELQVKISLVAQLDVNEKGHRSTPCAFIIADRSDLIKAQQQLRKEKQTVESLLDQILPHNIAVSLLNGQTELSFEVECACVLFSDIVSFTPMCSNMTAKQIMSTLNMLFTEFDTELAKFKRVTKLKTIGDAYVCAAGIFDGDGPIEEAASEIVTFGTRMQEIIPLLNQKIGTSIHMRIGIYTGGPLICGVLGKQKPLFEIIGQGVTLAEDLESSSLPDKLHISQSTADLIKPLNLRLIERGDDIKFDALEGQKTWTVQ